MFKPINQRLIVKVVSQEAKSLIVKPEAFKTVEMGIVCHEIVAIDASSKLLKVGDFAVYRADAGEDYFPEGNTPNSPEYRVLQERDLMGVKCQ